MRKKSRLFLSMASMVLTVALFCFGVYAALGVSYTISGSVVYQVKDVFVNIETSLYVSKSTTSLTNQDKLDENVALFETNPESAQTTTNTEKLAYSDGLKTYDVDTGLILEPTEDDLTSENIPINYGSYEIQNEGLENESAKGYAYYIVVSITNYGTESVSVTLTNNINNEQTNSLTKLSENTTIAGRTADKTYTTKHIVIGMALNDATKSVSDVNFNVPILIERGETTTPTLVATPEKYTIDEQAKTITINADATGDVVIGKGDETVTGLTLSSLSKDITSVYALPDCGDPTGQNHFITGLTVDAFCQSTNLQDVDLSNCLGITKILDGGYYGYIKGTFGGCNNLVSMVLPNNLQKIGSYAFAGCNSLKNIVIPNSVNDISNNCAFNNAGNTVAPLFENISYTREESEYSFNNGVITIYKLDSSPAWYSDGICPLIQTVIFPETIEGTQIGNNAFQCSGIKSISLPSLITSIGNDAFIGCERLDTVYIQDITKWCKIQFANGNSSPLAYGGDLYLNNKILTNVIWPDSMQSVNNYAFAGCKSLIEITIPDGVTSIGNNAFRGCSSLTDITIPDSVTSIGYDSFFICSSLTQITIPDSVQSIGSEAFKYCSSLETVYVEATTPPTLSIYYNSYTQFNNCHANLKIYVPVGCGETYKTATGWSTWADKIVEIEISPEPTLDKLSFYLINEDNAYEVRGKGGISGEIVIPSTYLGLPVTRLAEQAFFREGGITQVTIPNGVISIGAWAFDGCSSLTQITIPNSVQTIEGKAFNNCTALTEITIPDSVQSIENAFYGCSSLYKVIIDSEYAYQNATSASACGYLLQNATTVYVNKNLTETGTNSYLDSSWFTKVDNGDGYWKYTKNDPGSSSGGTASGL